MAELWDFGTVGIIEEPEGLRAFFEDAALLESVRAAFSEFETETREEAAPDREMFSRENWEPVFLGERFVVAPSWLDVEIPLERQLLKMDASSAFGTGRHESTQLVVRALEKYVSADSSVLDVGCGSGILSLVAAALGAGKVASCDADPEAIAVACRHLKTRLFQGSADAVRSGFADVTVANISAWVLDLLAGQLKRVTKPGGLVIVAGFLHENLPQLFQPDEVSELEGWLCWICRPDGISAGEDGELAARHDSRRWWS